MQSPTIEAWRAVQIRARTIDGDYLSSGYIVRSGRVLTCAHGLEGANSVAFTYWPDHGPGIAIEATSWIVVDSADIGCVLFDETEVGVVTPSYYGSLDNDSLVPIHAFAVGYPAYKFNESEHQRRREPRFGRVHPSSNPNTGTTEFRLEEDGPPPGDPSPWKGFSGAVVADDEGCVIGVVADDYPTSATSGLTVRRLDALYEDPTVAGLDSFLNTIGAPSRAIALTRIRDRLTANTKTRLTVDLNDEKRKRLTVATDLVSSPRLATYLGVAEGDIDGCLELYQRNSRLTAALFESVSWVEVVLRNAIDSRLRIWSVSNNLGSGHSDWCIHPGPLLTQFVGRDIREATTRARKALNRQPNHDDIVANLKFKTWRYLLPSRQRAKQRLWSDALAAAFPEAEFEYPKADSLSCGRHLANDVSILYKVALRVRAYEPLLNTVTPERHRLPIELKGIRPVIQRVLSSVGSDAFEWFHAAHLPTLKEALLAMEDPL